MVVIGKGQKATAGDLYQAYRRRCERNGDDPIPQRTFGTKFLEKGFISHRGTGGVREWHGIGLKGDASDAR